MTMITSSDEWESPAQLADRLGLPVSTIYRWNQTGDGPPSYRFGKHVRYKVSDVDKWAETKSRRSA
jgi:excisionase family DNA binding protein